MIGYGNGKVLQPSGSEVKKNIESRTGTWSSSKKNTNAFQIVRFILFPTHEEDGLLIGVSQIRSL